MKTEKRAATGAEKKMLAGQCVQSSTRCAQVRVEEMDGTIARPKLDRHRLLQDRISELEAANHKLTLERNTGLNRGPANAARLSEPQDALRTPSGEGRSRS